ncbi:MAG: extracellular solute-binding protein [candidate division KSB1 bacterium]|nr:extracellular solute-binding protein [candidate division KSB1 bacterium]MDZ7304760.1 extracellular solute-binding protein [candidate division KSB1 bacterium]MDZ7314206.1 extracellular solute-binding protein [candidate division KSB1 bacterium]
MYRHDLRAFLLMALAMLLGPACGEKKSQLIIYSPHGKELLEDFSSRFEQANPGVSVAWLDMASQNVLDRLRSEKANPQADIWWGAPAPLFMQAAAEGLLESYRPTWAEQIDSAYHDPLDRWYGTYLSPEVIMFNAEKLTRETAPQDWDELLEPRWRNKIAMREPLPSGTMRAIFFAMIYRFYRDHHSATAGFDWLRRLDANTKTYCADPTLLYLSLARGEADLTLWNLPDVLLRREQDGYAFDYIVPRSGTPMIPEGLAIVARPQRANDTERTQLARRFYEFVTTPEAFILAAQKYYRIPTRRDMDFSQIRPEFNPAQYKTMPMDWQLFADSAATWMQYWDHHIRRKGQAGKE